MLFVLHTVSDSTDHYNYLIEHPTRPSEKEIQKFLKKHGHDIGYENEHHLTECSPLPIPK